MVIFTSGREVEAHYEGNIHYLVWHSNTGDVCYDGGKVIYHHLTERLFHVVAHELLGPCKTWDERAA